MPRYYFSFTNDRRRVPDREGEVLRDEAAAREYAIEDARYLIHHSTTGITVEDGWRVEVSDHHGHVLFNVSLAEVADTRKPDGSDSG